MMQDIRNGSAVFRTEVISHQMIHDAWNQTGFVSRIREIDIHAAQGDYLNNSWTPSDNHICGYAADQH